MKTKTPPTRNGTATKSHDEKRPSPYMNQGNGNAGIKKSKKTSPFEKLFLDMLKDIYWAEQHLMEALPKMRDAASTESLKDAFDDHRHLTQKHVKRLEKVFGLLGEKPEAKKCDAMEALVKEGEKVMDETEENTMTRDAGLIISAQKIEHYEIATYGSLVQVALTLGHDEAALILEKTLNEEEDTDLQLTDIAETEVNPLADDEDDEDDDGNAGNEDVHADDRPENGREGQQENGETPNPQ